MTQQEPVATVLQNDDSDLDNLLDDVLDDFSGLSTADTSILPKKEQSLPDVPLDSDDDFAKQLQAGMEELLGDADMKAAFEHVWGSFDPAAAANNSTASFQDTIAQTMNKLKDSSKQSSIANENEGAFMAELMKQMQGLTDGGDFENVLQGMMSQLVSKEMLYEPMKDLVNKYPSWLKENKNKTDKDQYIKYEKQYDMCQRIVATYEAPGFDERNELQAKQIMDMMTQMQDYGQPPADLLEDMAPGINFNDPQGMPDLENCTIM